MLRENGRGNVRLPCSSASCSKKHSSFSRMERQASTSTRRLRCRDFFESSWKRFVTT